MDTRAIFSKRLFSLREEKGYKRQKAADDLSITRATLEYYEKGQRLPDIETLTKIADYYNVPADYLLGRSDAKSLDIEIQAVCDYTGLSERAVKTLARDFTLNGHHASPSEPLAEAIKVWAETANRIIEESFLTYFAITLSDLANISEYVSHTYVNITPMETLRLEEELNIKPNSLSNLLYKKMHEYTENTPTPLEVAEGEDPFTMDEKCDMYRYKLIKMIENINNLFDRRNDWRNCNREQLLEYLGITEEELKPLQAEAEHGKENE